MRAEVGRHCYLWRPESTIWYGFNTTVELGTRLGCLKDGWDEGSDLASDGDTEEVSYVLCQLCGRRSHSEYVFALDLSEYWHWCELKCELRVMISRAVRTSFYTSFPDWTAVWGESLMYSIADWTAVYEVNLWCIALRSVSSYSIQEVLRTPVSFKPLIEEPKNQSDQNIGKLRRYPRAMEEKEERRLVVLVSALTCVRPAYTHPPLLLVHVPCVHQPVRPSSFSIACTAKLNGSWPSRPGNDVPKKLSLASPATTEFWL